MKQIIIYVDPKKCFAKEYKDLIKLQIDNSLELGWDIKDIMLVTNFDYEYLGLKSILIDDDAYCSHSPLSTKIPGVLRMFDKGLIGDDLYWMHDLDAYQLVPISEDEIIKADIALCDYGRRPRWDCGSIFFRKEAKDIFEKQNRLMNKRRCADEVALYELTYSNSDLYNRVKKMNISYSFKPFNLRSCYRMAIKPLRIVHFDPFKIDPRVATPKLLDLYKGKNKINAQLIPDRLISLFKKYNMDGEFNSKRIKDGLELPGWKVIIPDCGRDDLPSFFVEKGYKVGVEIGVWKGEYGEVLGKSGLKIYGIDPYIRYDECLSYGGQNNLDEAHKIAKQVLAPYDYTIIKKTSMEALEDFKDESIDFVYIDGNHDFKYVTEDIWGWSKKVRKGGVISGHDYIHLGQPGYCDTKYVVNAYTAAKRIPKWYVLGKRFSKPGEKRDRERSWFWFKI